MARNVVGRCAQHAAHLAQLACHQVGGTQIADANGKVIALIHQVDDAIGHRYVEFHLRMARKKFGDGRRDMVLQINPGLPGSLALCAVLERWVAHLLGVQVAITPLQKIADEAWRWHVGLDVDSMALLKTLPLNKTMFISYSIKGRSFDPAFFILHLN